MAQVVLLSVLLERGLLELPFALQIVQLLFQLHDHYGQLEKQLLDEFAVDFPLRVLLRVNAVVEISDEFGAIIESFFEDLVNQ